MFQQYFELRSQSIQKLKTNEASNPYPHKYQVDISLSHFVKQFKDISDGSVDETSVLSVSGMSKVIINYLLTSVVFLDHNKMIAAFKFERLNTTSCQERRKAKYRQFCVS